MAITQFLDLVPHPVKIKGEAHLPRAQPKPGSEVVPIGVSSQSIELNCFNAQNLSRPEQTAGTQQTEQSS